jgi:hypothetical protein
MLIFLYVFHFFSIEEQQTSAMVWMTHFCHCYCLHCHPVIVSEMRILLTGDFGSYLCLSQVSRNQDKRLDLKTLTVTQMTADIQIFSLASLSWQIWNLPSDIHLLCICLLITTSNHEIHSRTTEINYDYLYIKQVNMFICTMN